MSKRKAVVSTILIILGMLCYLTGVILYFLDTGMFLFMSRGFIKAVHDLSGLLIGPFVIYHFYLNRKIYKAEMQDFKK